MSSIVVMNADGTGATAVAPGRLGTWSPDGQRIAMLRRSAAGATDVYTMDADGTDLAPVTNDGAGKFFPPAAAAAGPSHPDDGLVAGHVVSGEDVAFTSTVTSPGPTLNGLVQFRVNGENDGAPGTPDASGHGLTPRRSCSTPATSSRPPTAGMPRWDGARATRRSTCCRRDDDDAGLVAQPGHHRRADRHSRHRRQPRHRHPPFGSVQFSIDGAPIGPALELDQNGQVEVGLVAAVRAGSYSVRVDYVDDTAEIADFARAAPRSCSASRPRRRRRRRLGRSRDVLWRRRRSRGKTNSPASGSDRQGAAKTMLSPPCADGHRSLRLRRPERRRRRSTRGESCIRPGVARPPHADRCRTPHLRVTGLEPAAAAAPAGASA